VPGTFGSLAGLGVYYLAKDRIIIYLAATSCLIILGFLVSGRAERIFNKKDYRGIVIDEVCGMLLSLLFIPYELKFVIIAFFIFRLMDTVKPYPAGRLQDLKGSLGVMGDDIVAGIYTNIILQVVIRLASFKIS
jgi:phosphatidylglycerophosphatase A